MLPGNYGHLCVMLPSKAALLKIPGVFGNSETASRPGCNTVYFYFCCTEILDSLERIFVILTFADEKMRGERG